MQIVSPWSSRFNYNALMNDRSDGRIPFRIGLAVDLMTPPIISGHAIGKSSLLYLADLLLTYETVLIRNDLWTLGMLYGELKTEELEPLLRDGRLRFFSSLTPHAYGYPLLDPCISAPTGTFFDE